MRRAGESAAPAPAGDPPTTRRPNRRGEGSRLRDSILDAAAQLLEATGNENAVTLRAVARQAGIAAPSIYAHFPDRQAILVELVQAAFRDLAEHLETAEASSADPAESLRAICDAYLRYAAEQPHRYRTMFGGLWNAAEAVAASAVTADVVTALGQDGLQVVRTQLQLCIDAGVSSSTNAEDDAVALWLGLHGLAHQRSVSTGFPWPADIADRVINPLAGLSRPPQA